MTLSASEQKHVDWIRSLTAHDTETPNEDTEEPAGGAERPGGLAVVAPPVLLRPDNPVLRTRGILKRRDCSIVGYGGLNGQGKTMAMVRDMLLSLAMGRRVLSTVRILDPESGNAHPNFELFESWEQLHGVRDTDLGLDEVTGIMDSRDQGMPKHVKRMMPQMRRGNNRVSYTTINWDNADRRLRQLTKAFVICRGFFPVHNLHRDSGLPDAISMWKPNRGFLLTTYDAQTLQKSEDSAMLTEDRDRKRRARVLHREWVGYPFSAPIAFRAYDTLDSVSAVDNLCRYTDPRTGVVCGGKPVERQCRGH